MTSRNACLCRGLYVATLQGQKDMRLVVILGPYHLISALH